MKCPRCQSPQVVQSRLTLPKPPDEVAARKVTEFACRNCHLVEGAVQSEPEAAALAERWGAKVSAERER